MLLFVYVLEVNVCTFYFSYLLYSGDNADVAQLVFQFTLMVLGGVVVRALCRPVTFLNSTLGKRYVAGFVQGATAMLKRHTQTVGRTLLSRMLLLQRYLSLKPTPGSCRPKVH